MEEQLVSFETAKLAKEKGFYLQQDNFYTREGEAKEWFDLQNYNQLEDNIWMPTQSLLQKWLREVHKINILIKIGEFDDKFEYFIELKMLHKDLINSNIYPNDLIIKRPEEWFKYEEALELGLQKALELIKNK